MHLQYNPVGEIWNNRRTRTAIWWNLVLSILALVNSTFTSLAYTLGIIDLTLGLWVRYPRF